MVIVITRVWCHIIDKLRKDNVVAYFLSQLTNEAGNGPIEDSFSNWHIFIFVISSNTPWYADINNYLVVGKLPRHLSLGEIKHIIRQSAKYSWVEGYFIYTGLDLVIRRYVREDEIYYSLKACHDDQCSVNFFYIGWILWSDVMLERMRFMILLRHAMMSHVVWILLIKGQFTMFSAWATIVQVYSTMLRNMWEVVATYKG